MINKHESRKHYGFVLVLMSQLLIKNFKVCVWYFTVFIYIVWILINKGVVVLLISVLYFIKYKCVLAEWIVSVNQILTLLLSDNVAIIIRLIGEVKGLIVSVYIYCFLLVHST